MICTQGYEYSLNPLYLCGRSNLLAQLQSLKSRDTLYNVNNENSASNLTKQLIQATVLEWTVSFNKRQRIKSDEFAF